MKKDKITSWHGLGDSKVSSLFERNLLVRYDRSKKRYQCAYRIGKGIWGTAFLTEKDLENILVDESFDVAKFLKKIKIGLKEWTEMEFLYKLDKLISYAGTDNVFRSFNKIHSVREICKLTKVAYLQYYEFI